MIVSMINSWPKFIIFLLGYLIGIFIGVFLIKRPSHGTIYVTHGVETDKYLFEFNIPPEKIPQMKNVTFLVELKSEQSSQNLQSL